MAQNPRVRPSNVYGILVIVEETVVVDIRQGVVQTST